MDERYYRDRLVNFVWQRRFLPATQWRSSVFSTIEYATPSCFLPCGARLLIAFFLISGLLASAKGDEANSEPPVIRRISEISDLQRQNYSKIKTWQGECLIEDQAYRTNPEFIERATHSHDDSHPQYSGPIESIVQSSSFDVSFTCDVESDKLYSECKSRSPTRFYANPGNHELFLTVLSTHERAIVVPEHRLSVSLTAKYGPLSGFDDNTTTPPPPSPVVVREGRKISQGPAFSSDSKAFSGTVFDPRTIFGLVMAPWDELAMYPATFKIEGKDRRDKLIKMIDLIDTKDGKILLVLKSPSGSQEIHCVLSTDHSMLPISRSVFRVSGPDGKKQKIDEIQWSYKIVEGISIPSIASLHLFDADGNQVISRRTITFQSEKINSLIDPSEFTLDKFQLPNGTRYLDRIEGKLFRVLNGKPVEAREVHSLREPENRGFGIWNVVLYSNVIFVVAIGIYVFLRKFGKQKPGTL